MFINTLTRLLIDDIITPLIHVIGGAIAMKNKLLSFLIVFAFVLGGCATKTINKTDLSAGQLGRIGAQVHSKPDKADSVLDRYDLTQDEFKNAIKDIMKDPNKARSYREAFIDEKKR